MGMTEGRKQSRSKAQVFLHAAAVTDFVSITLTLTLVHAPGCVDTSKSTIHMALRVPRFWVMQYY